MYSFGIYDSGIGGLTTLVALKKAFPNCDFCFLADTKNNPLGTKKPLEIATAVNEGLEYLRAMSHIQVIACNTASTVAKPRGAYLLQPYLDDLSPSNTLLLSTPATARALNLGELGYPTADTKNLATAVEILGETAYKERDINVFNRIESTIKAIVENAIQGQEIDTIYLGCSHYNYFKNILKKLFPTIKIIDGNDRLISSISKENLTKGGNETAFDFTLGNQQAKYRWLVDMLEENEDFQGI